MAAEAPGGRQGHACADKARLNLYTITNMQHSQQKCSFQQHDFAPAISQRQQELKTSPLIIVPSSDEPHTFETTKPNPMRRYIAATDTFSSVSRFCYTMHS